MNILGPNKGNIQSRTKFTFRFGRAIAQAVSRRLQVMWDLWGTKWHWGRFSLSRFHRVLTMVYNTQNYWGFGLYPSSGF
jgi:hypothetical protein